MNVCRIRSGYSRAFMGILAALKVVSHVDRRPQVVGVDGPDHFHLLFAGARQTAVILQGKDDAQLFGFLCDVPKTVDDPP